jgi:hypothetical protein
MGASCSCSCWLPLVEPFGRHGALLNAGQRELGKRPRSLKVTDTRLRIERPYSILVCRSSPTAYLQRLMSVWKDMSMVDLIACRRDDRCEAGGTKFPLSPGG